VKSNCITVPSSSGTASNVTLYQTAKPVPTISKIPEMNRVIAPDRSKFVVGSGKNTFTGLSAAPTLKFSDLIVSQLNPDDTADLFKFELFSEFDAITVTQMLTKHPRSYENLFVKFYV